MGGLTTHGESGGGGGRERESKVKEGGKTGEMRAGKGGNTKKVNSS